MNKPAASHRRSGPYPAGSATWVDPQKVLLGRPIDMIGILRENQEGCLYLETEDGELFYLVIGPEFREQWPVVLPGNGVRVRGLLNKSRPCRRRRACAQRDGDIYHPIMADYNWTGESCCDPFVCGFLYGDRVVLIGEDDPNGAVDLPRGASGTIICCKSGVENSVLVSWDLWTNGGADDAYLACNERLTGLFPPRLDVVGFRRGSRQMVPDGVRHPAGNPTLLRRAVRRHRRHRPVHQEPRTGITCRTWRPMSPLPGDAFLASGLYAPYATLPDRAGRHLDPGPRRSTGKVILHSVLLPCPVPSCCEPAYVPGERVDCSSMSPAGPRTCSSTPAAP